MTYYHSEHYQTHDRTSCSDNFPCNAEPNGHGCHRCNALLFDEHDKYQKALMLIAFNLSDGESLSCTEWKRRVERIVKNALKGEDE
jgi:hypothetical protein